MKTLAILLMAASVALHAETKKASDLVKPGDRDGTLQWPVTCSGLSCTATCITYQGSGVVTQDSCDDTRGTFYAMAYQRGKQDGWEAGQRDNRLEWFREAQPGLCILCFVIPVGIFGVLITWASRKREDEPANIETGE
jgi:hypothetical protein